VLSRGTRWCFTAWKDDRDAHGRLEESKTGPLVLKRSPSEALRPVPNSADGTAAFMIVETVNYFVSISRVRSTL
jgi:hypothetical protein